MTYSHSVRRSYAHGLSLLIATLFIISGIVFAAAQTFQIPNVSQEEMASHLMTYVAPIYPAGAQSAKIQGDVTAKVEIGPDGFVRSVRVLSGPAALRQASTTALRKWRYRPFQHDNGNSAVTGHVVVSFSLDKRPEVHTPGESSANGSTQMTVTFPSPNHQGEPDAEIATRFDVPWEACTRGVIAIAADETTANSCKQAAAIADEFAPDRRFQEKRLAYIYAADAYGNLHDFQTALPYADKAVEVVKLGHADESGSGAAYSVRGEIRALSGDMDGGDKDLTVAEELYRKGKLSSQLKKELQFHAELLKRMNRPQEAQVKLDEAAKL
jgi:TonB family protein